MKSIFINKETHELHFADISLPAIKRNEILVKTLRVGLCSTERELFEKEFDPPENCDFLILGHEAVGEIVEVGADVSQFRKGDIVVPSVRRGCGECLFCNNGRTDMCNTGKYIERGIVKLHGFMSEYFVEQEEHLTKIPRSLKSQAVLLEPLTVGIKAIEEYFKVQKSRLLITPDISEEELLRNVLIIGAGPIGLLVALVVAHHQASITCIDIDNEEGNKADITRMIGGQYINIGKYLEDGKINLDKLRKEKTIGEFDLIIDASPDPITCVRMVDLLSFNGAIVNLGLPYGNKGFLPADLFDYYITSVVLKNGVILGSVNANRSNFDTGVKYMEEWQKKFSDVLDRIITHRFDFRDYEKAFKVESPGRIKVVLEWS